MDIVHSLHAALGGPEPLWLALTSLGRDEVFIVVLALYSWLVNPAGMRRLGVAFGLSYLLNSLLKYGLNLSRPFALDPAVASPAAQATGGGPGFPSGHAQLSATLWLGMAAQLGRRWFWWVAGVLVLLISLSRIVLGVHYPLDVLGGLLLGGLFAWVAVSGRFPWNWWVPVLLLVVAAALPASVPREYSVGLGLTAGFWLLRPTFQAPRSWPARIGVAVVGLVLVFAVYFGLSALLPHAIRDLGGVRAVRYFLLVLMAGEVVPRVLRFWMQPDAVPVVSRA
ncbi:phosphatase PAP2 family protein [Deinococcus sonorensis]|uniref:Phosphatase PAP2 family protein n=2 Tax=Deinococcus sonorensis TaxID=309891 RepID=A0AAU7U9M2_9DEIO